MKSGNKTAVRMLVFCIMLQGSSVGILQGAAAVLTGPVCATNGFALGDFTLYYTFSSIAGLVIMPFAGKLMSKLPLRPTLLVCSVVWICLFGLCSQFHQLWMFYVAYLVIGIVSCIPGYIVAPVVATNWFEKKRGLAVGLVLASRTAFNAIFGIVAGKVIEVADAQATYLVLAAIAAVFMIPSACGLVLHPAKKGMLPYGASVGAQAQTAQQSGNAAALPGVPSKQAYRSATFYCMFLMMGLLTFVAAISSQLAILGEERGLDIAMASVLSSMFSIGGLIGSNVGGILNDKLGTKITACVGIAVAAVGVILMLASKNSMAMLVIGIIFLAFGYSSGNTQIPLLVASMFGMRDNAAIYSTLQMAMSISSMFGNPLIGYMYDGTGSYNPVLIMIFVVLGAILLLMFAALKTSKKLESKWVRA